MTPYGTDLTPLARELARTFGATDEDFGPLVGLLRKLLQAQGRGDTAIPVSEEEETWLATRPWVSDDGHTPLVLRDGWLQFQRLWKAEARIARRLRAMTTASARQTETTLDDAFLAAADQFGLDGEKLTAIRRMLGQRLTLLTGGPGTGKTTTLAWLLAAHLRAEAGLDFALAAPTGKAAQRMSDAIGNAAGDLPLDDAARARLAAVTPVTLHRLLSMDGNGRPGHHAGNPLPHALVVVDEASMVDVTLMAQLVDALRPDARLVLMGDPDQLASVEAGRVLSDLIDGLPEAHVQLEKTHRFPASIKALADAIRQGESDSAWRHITQNGQRLDTDLMTAMVDGHADYAAALRQPAGEPAAQARALLEALERFRVLAPLRRGPTGVETLNRTLLLHWASQGLLQPAGEGVWAGMPVLVTRNAPGLGLSNGDTGVLVPDGSLLKAWFRRGKDVEGLPLTALPPWEPALAMTVHKAQGGEFDRVLLVLPDKPHELVSRQLLYTAVTRAKKAFRLAGDEAVLRSGIERPISRTSRLLTRLRETDGA